MGVSGRPETIRDTARKVYSYFDSIRIEPEYKEWGATQLEAIQHDLDQVLRGEDGYEDHLLAYVSRETDAFHADGPEASPTETRRETALCTCEDQGCTLKHGRLPNVVLDAETIRGGIKRFKQDHHGTPTVLLEAQETWSEKRARCWRVLRRCKTYMHPEIDAIPPDANGAFDDAVDDGDASGTDTTETATTGD